MPHPSASNEGYLTLTNLNERRRRKDDETLSRVDYTN
jgi:hypothetical protein